MSATESSRPDEVPTAEDRVPAVDGRVPGRRGRRTRDRLLEATAELLATRSYRDVKVVDIARQVGTSPATFYQYFPGVEAAVQLLARRVAQAGSDLVTPVGQRSWRGREAWEASQELVDAFLGFWLENAAVLRVIDLAIVEGDDRFREIRADLLGPVTAELRDAIASRRGVDGDEALAEAAVLLAMLAHAAEHQEDLEVWGVGLPAVRTRLAEHVHWGVTGRRHRG
jgi:AcrR family transcriptional regulator